MNNTEYDIRFFKGYTFTDTNVLDKDNNVVATLSENGCFCFPNGIMVRKQQEPKKEKTKKIKINL